MRFPHLSHSERQFLLSLCAIGIHPIVLYHFSSQLCYRSIPRCGAAVFLKKEGSEFDYLFAADLKKHGIILTKLLGDAIDRNWEIFIEHQPVESHNDCVPLLEVKEFSDGCFGYSTPPDVGNSVRVDCDESSTMRFSHLSLSDRRFLLSLCAFGFHPIVLYHFSSQLWFMSMPRYGASVFLKKEGSELKRLSALVLEAHDIMLTELLGDVIDKNWENFSGHQPVESHNDDVPLLEVIEISDGCFEYSTAPDMGNSVHVDCDESNLHANFDRMLGNFRDLMEANTGNISWFFKNFSGVIYKVFSGLNGEKFLSPYLPSYITKAFESFDLANLVAIAILLQSIAAIVLRSRIGAFLVRCFTVPKWLQDSLLAIGKCSRDRFNYPVFIGMLEVYFIALTSNGGRHSLADPFIIVNLVMAYILLSAAISKQSSRYGLILAGGVILSTVVLICWNILCTVPTTYWRGVANIDTDLSNYYDQSTSIYFEGFEA